MRWSTLLALLAGVILCWNFQARTLHAADELTIDTAIEALADEDAATRTKAEEFLRAQGDKAIPALKKASETAEPEVRKRAAALLTIAKRGVISIKITDQAGKPVADTEFQVMLFKVEDGRKVYAYGSEVYMDNVKPMLDLTLKTSAEGMLTTTEVNQDDYTVLIKTGGDLPKQNSKQDVSNKDGSKAIEWKIFRGSGLTVKIVDENDKPLADTSVFFPEGWGEFAASGIRSTSDRKLAKRLENYTKDTCAKTGADGMATFKSLFGAPPTLVVFHAGFARVEKTSFKLEDGKNVDIGTIKLMALKTSTVKITVVDKDKKPLKGVTVMIVDSDQKGALAGYVEEKKLPKVLDWKYAHSAGPSDDNGVATATLPPGEYAFAVAHGETSSLLWVNNVENGVDLDCGLVVLP